MLQALIAAIEADPGDEAAQLVIADYLQADGDPRGDLIVLDHADRRGLLVEPAAIEQTLLLAAEYGFPRAAPEDPPLPSSRDDEYAWRVEYRGLRYDLRCDGGDERFTLVVRAPEDEAEDDAASHRLDLPAPPWSREDEAAITQILSDVIRHATPLDDVRFPWDSLPLPRYDGGPLRCYMLPVDFLRAYSLLRNRYGLAARDYHRWHALWNRLVVSRR